MKVTILHIIEPTTFGTVVEFSTTYGVGRSLFSSAEIQENQTYDVEIDIDDDFIWSENITLSSDCAPSIHFNSGGLHITAELISNEEDGCGALKLGDAIILISLNKTNQSLPVFVDILAQSSSLHPTNI